MFGKLIKKLGNGRPVWARSAVTGEVRFEVGGKIHHLQGGQRVCLNQIGNKHQLMAAAELHDLLKQSYIILER